MGRKAKFSFDVKMDIVTRCLSGEATANHEAKLLGVYPETIHRWISLYQSLGTDGLITTSKNSVYSADTKRSAVLDYLNGKGSQVEICKKYEIRSTKQLHQWILKYNSHEKIKSSGTGGSKIMTKGKKTTFDERVAIVEYCISHDKNYAETAETFGVSYQQARNYTIKYEESGVEGLRDKRGRRKSENEMSELEKLRAENRILRAQKKQAEMEVSFLKKLEEIERRRG